MRCGGCQSEVSGRSDFCPRCGSPVPDHDEAGSVPAPPAEAGSVPAPPADARAPRTGTTAVLTPDAPMGGFVADARAAVRRAAALWRPAAARLAGQPRDVRLATVGAVLTAVGFLVLPYRDGAGAAVTAGGRLWWRPITAVAAAVLLAVAARGPRRTPAAPAAGHPSPPPVGAAATAGRQRSAGEPDTLAVPVLAVEAAWASGSADAAAPSAAASRPAAAEHPSDHGPDPRRGDEALLAAALLAAAGAAEAGAFALVSAASRGLSVGFYAMLAGALVVLVATTRALHARLGAPAAPAPAGAAADFPVADAGADAPVPDAGPVRGLSTQPRRLRARQS